MSTLDLRGAPDAKWPQVDSRIISAKVAPSSRPERSFDYATEEEAGMRSSIFLRWSLLSSHA